MTNADFMHLFLIIGGFLGVMGFIISLICVACVVGFTRSTHQVQYVPLEPMKNDLLAGAEELLEEEEEIKESLGRKKKKPAPINEVERIMEEITSTDIHI